MSPGHVRSLSFSGAPGPPPLMLGGHPHSCTLSEPHPSLLCATAPWGHGFFLDQCPNPYSEEKKAKEKPKKKKRTRNIKNGKLHSRKVSHLCYRWAGNHCDQQSQVTGPLSPLQQDSLTICSATNRLPASKPHPRICGGQKSSLLKQRRSHLRTNKTVDFQRYTNSPASKLYLSCYMYPIFIQEILTECLLCARQCCRCRNRAVMRGEKIFMDLNTPDLSCDTDMWRLMCHEIIKLLFIIMLPLVVYSYPPNGI